VRARRIWIAADLGEVINPDGAANQLEGGAGEPSFGPSVAAIANAIHDALGVRPRAMPFTPENLAAAMG